METNDGHRSMNLYRLTPEAARDLDEIIDFIAQDHPKAAARLLGNLKERCQALAERPDMGRNHEELARNLRSSHVGKYVLFYRTDAEGIAILRILHGARDLPGFFQ